MTRAQLILQELKHNGVTHVVGLPDNSSAALLKLLQHDTDIRFVAVTREGEAFALAAGLWIGGQSPVVLVQNTGFFESGDSLRGTAIRMRIPLVCLITYRGYGKLAGLQDVGMLPEVNAETLSQAHLDSAALITEPTLKAWGMPFDFLRGDDDVPKLFAAFRKAAEGAQPVALLITEDMS